MTDLSEHKWWEEEDGTCICHLCTKPVDPSDPETMFGLSGAPVHGKCGREAMERGKVVKVGERAREEVPLKLHDRVIGTARVSRVEDGFRIDATVTDERAIEELTQLPSLGFSIGGGA